MSDSTTTTVKPMIFGAMVRVMRAVEAIEKDRQATAGPAKYRYRGIDDVMNGLHDVLAKEGVFVVTRYTERAVTERSSSSGNKLFHIVLTGHFRFTAEDGSSLEASAFGEAMDSGDKATLKAQSVALRTVLLQCFVIPTEEGDKDPEDKDPVIRQEPAPQPQQRTAAAVELAGLWKASGRTAAQFPEFAKAVIGKARVDDDADRQKLIEALREQHEAAVADEEIA